MRILVIGPLDEGRLAASYARAFEQVGHEVVRFDSDRAYFQASWYAGNRWARRLFRRTLWNRVNLFTIEAVRCVRPSLVVAFKAACLHAETIRRIRTAESIPIVNYYPDYPYCSVPLDPRKPSAQRHDLISVLREYTHVFIWEKALADRLTKDAVSASYLPFGADTDVFAPGPPFHCEECKRDHRVVFVGLHTTPREREIGCIRRHEVALWGPGWGRASRRFDGRHIIHARRMFGRDCAAIYAGADVCLNILNWWNVPGHNMRTLEIPASGGVMLSTYTSEQAEFFPEGQAAWYYRDPLELDDVIERLLRDKRARDRTRDNALRIAGKHEYTRRAEELIQRVFEGR